MARDVCDDVEEAESPRGRISMATGDVSELASTSLLLVVIL